MARSFSELVARVGRDQRGAPKVQVVLSVYCLTRDTGVPVPTSEVTEFLKLHLRRTGLPANVAMVLARARPYVEIVSANGSRVWRVTQSGTEWLEGLTGERLAANLDGEVSLRLRDLHPEVRSVANSLLEGRHYAEAVGRAAKTLNRMVRQKTGRSKDSGVAMMHQTFSKEPNGSTRLVINALKDDTERDEQEGVRFLMAGVQAAVANVDKHGDLALTDATHAMELLAMISFLARVIDRSSKVDP